MQFGAPSHSLGLDGKRVGETHAERNKNNYSSHYPNREVMHAPPSANGLAAELLLRWEGRRDRTVVV